MKNLITAGELAKLASTTKRTIQFYDQKGILKPFSISTANYRLYEERQVLDYQMILLLSTLGVSLREIKDHLKKKGSLNTLFNKKKQLIKDEVQRLQFSLKNIENYLTNLQDNGTMVDPQIKMIKPFKIYYVEKIGPYAKIGQYCQELVSMFNNKNLTTLSIFEEQGYRPKKSRIKIGVLVKQGIKIKEKYKNIIKKMTFSPGKVISYTYYGSGDMLSLFWKELEKYCRIKGYKIRMDIPDYEIYWKVNKNPIRQKFEIFLPIN